MNKAVRGCVCGGGWLHHVLFSLLVLYSTVVTAARANARKQILLMGVSYEYYHSATMEVVHH